MSKRVGYSPGQGRTFTPSLTGKWFDDFNSLLESEGTSRNSLTEELIECGLKVKKHEHLFISTENLSSEQIALLSSKEGQKILLNVAMLLLGNPNNSLSAMLTTGPLNTVQPEVEESRKIEVKTVEHTEEVHKVEIADDKSLLETLPERLIFTGTDDNEQNQIVTLTPQEKLREKMKMLKQTKSDLKG